MDKPIDQQLTSSQIIDRLGGTTAVATLCQVKPPSVSEWRREGIPAARRQYLELVNPRAFDPNVPDADLIPAVKDAA